MKGSGCCVAHTCVASEYGVAEFLSTSNDPNMGIPELEGLSCCCGTIFTKISARHLKRIQKKKAQHSNESRSMQSSKEQSQYRNPGSILLFSIKSSILGGLSALIFCLSFLRVLLLSPCFLRLCSFPLCSAKQREKKKTQNTRGRQQR